MGQWRHFDRAPITSGLPGTDKRTFSEAAGMSQMCQQRKSALLFDQLVSIFLPGCVPPPLGAVLLGNFRLRALSSWQASPITNSARSVVLAWTPSAVVLPVLLQDIRDLEETEEFGRDPS